MVINKDIFKQIDQKNLREIMSMLVREDEIVTYNLLTHFDANRNAIDSVIDDMVSQYEAACLFYTAIAPFPTPEKVLAFRKLFSIAPKYAKYFIGMDKVVPAIEKVWSSGIFIPAGEIIHNFYRLYLPTKIKHEMMQAFDFYENYNGGEMNIASIGYFKLMQNLKNRKEKGTSLFKNEFEEYILKLENYINSFEDNSINFRKLMKAELNGKVEKMYFKELVNNTILLNPHFSKQVIYENLFELFKVLFIDKEWVDEQDFIDIDAIYGNNYKKYKYIQISNIFNR